MKFCRGLHVGVPNLYTNYDPNTMLHSTSSSKSSEDHHSDEEPVKITKGKKLCDCRVCDGKLVAYSTWYKHRNKEMQEQAGEIPEKQPWKKRKQDNTVHLS